MDWIKVKVKHAEYDFATAPAEIFKTWIMTMIFVAATERKPLRNALCNRLGEQHYENLEKWCEKCGVTIDEIIDKVLEDVDHINSRKLHSRKYMKKYRCNTLRKPLRVDNVMAKRREEKRREEKEIPPSLEEVFSYCKDRKNGINAEAFINHYQAKGWMIGKNKMKDWRAAVRTWEKPNDPKKQSMNTL